MYLKNTIETTQKPIFSSSHMLFSNDHPHSNAPSHLQKYSSNLEMLLVLPTLSSPVLFNGFSRLAFICVRIY